MPNLITLSCANAALAAAINAAAAAMKLHLPNFMMPPSLTLLWLWSASAPCMAERPDQEISANGVVNLREPQRLEQQEADDHRAVENQRGMRGEVRSNRQGEELGGPGDQIVEQHRHEQDQRCAQETTQHAAHAADDDRGENLDRQVEMELLRGDGFVVAECKEPADDSTDKRAHPESKELVAECAHADDLGRVILLPYRSERAPEARPANVEHEERNQRADGKNEVIVGGVAGEREPEEANLRRLQCRLRATADGGDMDDHEVDQVLHGERGDGEIEALHAQRRGAEEGADAGGEEPAGGQRELERDTGAREMDRAIGADRHDGAVTEMDLARTAHENVQAQCRRGPDEPRQQIAREVETAHKKWRREQQQDNCGHERTIEGQGPELTVLLVAGMADAGETVKHVTPSRC